MLFQPLALVLLASVVAPQGQNPFLPPSATYHYAPDRTCDLRHVKISVDVDWTKRSLKGTTVNTMAPLRSGVRETVIHAGTGLQIHSVKVDGEAAAYKRDGRKLIVQTGVKRKGESFNVTISYTSTRLGDRPGAMADQGWHWIRASQDASRAGFWTQGWAEHNSEWAPTWDYSNDLATSETITTVPGDWQVVGNGALVQTTASPDKKRKTYHWRMAQPHATYLISLCGGPFDIKMGKWNGLDLWYVVPKGMGSLIDNSFSDTPDMLEFFSQKLGVTYPWPKYAQNAMYDFGGGMENVSSTTLGEMSLTEPRDGFRRMASLNSHELAHQWFGDLVTCKDWGDVWLNESFATFMQGCYFEHSRGRTGYDWEIEDYMQSYFREARRYKRPISTKLYPNADSMLDSHSYPKGAAVLHTLRRQLGEEAFWGGLKRYLTSWKHTAVESAQLRRTMTEATGIEMERFWAQWIEKPGHPVLDYAWTFKPDGPAMGPGKIILTVKQIQDTKDGTPIYDIWTEIGYVREGVGASGMNREPIHLSKAEETFEIKVPSAALAVVLDPEHKFLREIPNLHWSAQELPFILQSSPNAPDRQEALNRLLRSPTENALKLVTEQIAKDKDAKQPVFRNLSLLVNLSKPELRGFWTEQLSHSNIDRQVQAAQGLAKLPVTIATTAKFQSLLNDKAPIQVVVTAINALAEWDAKGNANLFRKAQGIKDRRGQIKRAADEALTKAGKVE